MISHLSSLPTASWKTNLSEAFALTRRWWTLSAAVRTTFRWVGWCPAKNHSLGPRRIFLFFCDSETKLKVFLVKSTVLGVNVKLGVSFPAKPPVECCETAAVSREGSFVLVFVFFLTQFFGEVSAAYRGGRQEAGEGRPHDMRQPEKRLQGGFSGFCGCDDEKSVTVASK